MRLICTVTVILSIASSAFAQQIPPKDTPPRLIISDRAVAMGIAATPPARIQQSRDSLANGAIIGAILGAAVLGGGGAYLCHALKEEGDPPCWKGVLVVGALGAGAGAVAGLGIDALFARQHQRRAVSRFSNQ